MLGSILRLTRCEEALWERTGKGISRENWSTACHRHPDDIVFGHQDADGMSNKLLGSLGEELAARYLEQRGYDIIDRNYRCPEGEADLVAYDQDDDGIVLVEVKTRRSRSERGGAYPEEAVTPEKQRRYRRIALCYAADHYPVPSIRFDVIGVTLRPANIGEIRHLCGAFDWSGR